MAGEQQEQHVHRLLPLRWSLYYVMTRKEWREFRERIKRQELEWERCSCPKGCRATECDELWEYQEEHSVKRFRGATFICRACHWLKSPSFRIKTWQQHEASTLLTLTRKPHIIDCLDWSDEQVGALKEKDLAGGHAQAARRREIVLDVFTGVAVVVPWSVDLSALGQYGYQQAEITNLEQRMMAVARARLADTFPLSQNLRSSLKPPISEVHELRTSRGVERDRPERNSQ